MFNWDLVRLVQSCYFMHLPLQKNLFHFEHPGPHNTCTYIVILHKIRIQYLTIHKLYIVIYLATKNEIFYFSFIDTFLIYF